MSKHNDRRNLFQKQAQPKPAMPIPPTAQPATASTPSPQAPVLDDETQDVDDVFLFEHMTFSEAFRFILNESLESGRLPNVATHEAYKAALSRHSGMTLRNKTGHINELRTVAGQASNMANAIAAMFLNLTK